MLGVLIGMLPTTAFATYNVSADPRDNADLWKVALQKGSTTHSVPLYASDSTVEYWKDQWAGNNHLQGVAVDDDMRYLYEGQQYELDEATWAKELGKKGIRVVGVAPGILEATGLRTLSYETALAYTRGITIEQLREGYSKTSTTPLGRSGKLSEVANTVAFLLSDRASYVHGVTLNVAGGKTRG